MGRGGKGAKDAANTTIGRQLNDITARLDHLERTLQDLTPTGSKRVLDRMHELEQVTRQQCIDLLRILEANGNKVMQTFRRAELLVHEAEATCQQLEFNLTRRADKERQETVKVQNELKETIEAIDTRATARVQEVEDKLQQAANQIMEVQTKIVKVTNLCDKTEAVAAAAQQAAFHASDRAKIACKRQFAEWASPQELKDKAVQRARSAQPGDPSMAWIIHMAQEAASKSPRRAAQRSASRESNGGVLFNPAQRGRPVRLELQPS